MTELLPPQPILPDLRTQWMLDSRITFLNHGSFGAMPRAVFDEQTRWRERIEAEPIEMIGRQIFELISDAKRPLAAWLGMNEADFGLVTNATEGINAILQSIELHPQQELLTTNHVYHAVRQAMKHAARRAGASYREVEIPLPVRSGSDIEAQVIESLLPKTRLLVIDHVTSPTALIFPVERICAECNRRGIDVLVDGAHAPGMVPLNVPAVGAAYYAGNLHKWVCAPKGCAFLWARGDRREFVHPLVISHYLGEGFLREFGWQGTRDFSAWFTIPKAIEFMSSLGWDAVMRHNHQLAAWAHQMLSEKWKVEPISPLDGSLLGSMATLRLPTPLAGASQDQTAALQRRLYHEHHVEGPLMRWNDQVFVRPCCQVYNTPEDYNRLAEAVLSLAKG